MISTGVYSSWQKIQEEKFAAMKARIDKDLMEKLFRKKLVLDIGCGNGYFEKFFSGSFIGIDKDRAMLAKSVSIFPRVLGSGDALPFADSTFDTVVSIDAMHLVKEDDFVRVLKPGGFVLFSTFFNEDNYEEKKRELHGRLKGFFVAREFVTEGREKEYVLVAIKLTFG